MADYIDRETILDDLDIDIQVTNKKRRLAQERNCVEDRMRYHKKLDYLRGFYQYTKSLPTADVIPIPEGATNGDMIKAMFPNARVSEIFPSCNGDEVYYVSIEKFNCVTNGMRIMKSWWNAPYKRESEE